MIRGVLMAVIACVCLTACGIDGAPTPPEPKATPKPGLTVSGRVEVGIVGGSKN